MLGQRAGNSEGSRKDLRETKPRVVSGGAQAGRGASERSSLKDEVQFFRHLTAGPWKTLRVSEVRTCLQPQPVPSSEVLSQLANTARGGSWNRSHHCPSPLSAAPAKVIRDLLVPNPRVYLILLFAPHLPEGFKGTEATHWLSATSPWAWRYSSLWCCPAPLLFGHPFIQSTNMF